MDNVRCRLIKLLFIFMLAHVNCHRKTSIPLKMSSGLAPLPPQWDSKGVCRSHFQLPLHDTCCTNSEKNCYKIIAGRYFHELRGDLNCTAARIDLINSWKLSGKNPPPKMQDLSATQLAEFTMGKLYPIRDRYSSGQGNNAGAGSGIVWTQEEMLAYLIV
jgi:hypothetical protein